MKIRVTFEVDDTDRVAISVASGTGFKNASRQQIEEFVASAVEARLANLRNRFTLATEQIAGASLIVEEAE